MMGNGSSADDAGSVTMGTPGDRPLFCEFVNIIFIGVDMAEREEVECCVIKK